MAEALPLGRAQLEFSSQAPGPAFSVMVQPVYAKDHLMITETSFFSQLLTLRSQL